MNNDKKLMVLGASFPQIKLIEAAKELGYKTVVCSIQGDYPAFQKGIADEIAIADISDPEQVTKAAKDYMVDGIATCCLDTGIRALGYACSELGFVGLSQYASECCSDKLKMKDAFIKAGVATAEYRKVSSKSDLETALNKLELPVILKATDLQGSAGIYICQNDQEVYQAFEELKTLTKRNYCIIEEYIVGNELGAQAFVYHGEILFVLPHGDNTYMSHTAVPIGHYVPLEMNMDLQDKVKNECIKAIRSIELDNCAVNIDLIEKDGKIYLIELTGRAGATCLPELVSIWYGIDYYKMIAAMAMGDDPRVFFNKKADQTVPNASRMLLSEKAGIVKQIKNDVSFNSNIYELSLIIQKGSQVNKFTNAKDRIGQVIVKGESYEECNRMIESIQNNISIELE